MRHTHWDWGRNGERHPLTMSLLDHTQSLPKVVQQKVSTKFTLWYCLFQLKQIYKLRPLQSSKGNAERDKCHIDWTTDWTTWDISFGMWAISVDLVMSLPSSYCSQELAWMLSSSVTAIFLLAICSLLRMVILISCGGKLTSDSQVKGVSLHDVLTRNEVGGRDVTSLSLQSLCTGESVSHSHHGAWPQDSWLFFYLLKFACSLTNSLLSLSLSHVNVLNAAHRTTAPQQVANSFCVGQRHMVNEDKFASKIIVASVSRKFSAAFHQCSHL